MPAMDCAALLPALVYRVVVAPVPNNLLGKLHEPFEERIPGGWVVPDPRQHVEHDRVHGVEEQVVIGEVLAPK